jgi:hypothetical protein
LAKCGCVPDLHTLDLTDCPVTDVGVCCVGKLRGLRYLFMRRTLVTDQGLPEILDLSELDWLDLSETQVTDGGVRLLCGLSGLTTLYLEHTQVTTECVWDLMAACWPTRTLEVVC